GRSAEPTEPNSRDVFNFVVEGAKMRKRIVSSAAAQEQERRWLDLEHAATVEVTSEDKDFPIESSLSLESGQGWRAAAPGTQTIRLLFNEPQDIKCISLVFEEDKVERTQEFALRCGGLCESLYASNGISAHLRRSEKRK